MDTSAQLVGVGYQKLEISIIVASFVFANLYFFCLFSPLLFLVIIIIIIISVRWKRKGKKKKRKKLALLWR